MEFLCPVCGKFTEVRERLVFGGSSFRCAECWSGLQVESLNPFRVRVEKMSHKSPVIIGCREARRGEKNG